MYHTAILIRQGIITRRTGIACELYGLACVCARGLVGGQGGRSCVYVCVLRVHVVWCRCREWWRGKSRLLEK
jgi:hypothetical protein